MPTSQPRRGIDNRQPARPVWVAGSLIDAGIVIGTTLATTLLLLLISGQLHDTTAGNLIARSPAPALEPIANGQSLIGNPSPSPQFSRSAASPLPSPPEDAAVTSATDDSTIQSAIEKKLQDNPDLSSYPITLTIGGGTVTLDGTVPSEKVKEKIEKLVKTVTGVKQVDNQIVVVSGN